MPQAQKDWRPRGSLPSATRSLSSHPPLVRAERHWILCTAASLSRWCPRRKSRDVRFHVGYRGTSRLRMLAASCSLIRASTSPHRQEHLLPQLLPFRRLVEPFGRIDHAVFVLRQQRRLHLARGIAIEIVEHLLTVRR